MLHGWGQTQAMFRHQVEGLARAPRRHRRPARARLLRQAPPRLPHRPAGPRRPGAARPPRDRPRRRARLVDGRVGVVELHRPVRHRPDPPVRGRRPARRGGRGPVDVGAGADRQRRDLRRVGAARPRLRRWPLPSRRRRPRESCAACSPASPTPRSWAFVAQEINEHPALRRGAAAVGPLRAGLARRAAPHRRAHAGDRLRRQPRRPQLAALTSPSRSPGRSCTCSGATWRTRTSRSWRTRRRSTRWWRSSSSGDVVRRRVQDRLDLRTGSACRAELHRQRGGTCPCRRAAAGRTLLP